MEEHSNILSFNQVNWGLLAFDHRHTGSNVPFLFDEPGMLFARRTLVFFYIRVQFCCLGSVVTGIEFELLAARVNLIMSMFIDTEQSVFNLPLA